MIHHQSHTLPKFKQGRIPMPTPPESMQSEKAVIGNEPATLRAAKIVNQLSPRRDLGSQLRKSIKLSPMPQGPPLAGGRSIDSRLSVALDLLRSTSLAGDAECSSQQLQKQPASLASMLDQATRFAQLVEESPDPMSRSKRKLGRFPIGSTSAPLTPSSLPSPLPEEQSGRSNKRVRFHQSMPVENATAQRQQDPCLPPRGIRYQRRNSFVIPKHQLNLASFSDKP